VGLDPPLPFFRLRWQLVDPIPHKLLISPLVVVHAWMAMAGQDPPYQFA
jgi:hypothetical protein